MSNQIELQLWSHKQTGRLRIIQCNPGNPITRYYILGVNSKIRGTTTDPTKVYEYLDTVDVIVRRVPSLHKFPRSKTPSLVERIKSWLKNT